jgi:hypothetical protein
MALSFTLDENDAVLELVEQQEDGLFVRDNGDWAPVDTAAEQPTIFDLEWVDVNDEALDFWDKAQTEDSDVTRSEIEQYLIPSE